MGQKTQIKLRAGKYRRPATLEIDTKHIYIQFGFNRKLMEEVKAMEGARWMGFDEKRPRKVWRVNNSERNQFQIRYLAGENPYRQYESDPLDIQFNRTSLFNHQKQMATHALSYRCVVWAAEMGTGKTLAAIEVIEHVNDDRVWYVGPKSGVVAVQREFKKWKCPITPEFMTYERLVKVMKGSYNVPRIVIFDESSKIKTPTSQRSKAAFDLATHVRSIYGDAGYVILMSGTPAPKSPVDWWHQCEVACPGFLREGNIHKFKARLCLIEQRESITGGMYPHVVTWWDDKNKCETCGKPEYEHAVGLDHKYKKSTNEIEYLYKRMRGLTLVKFKADCIDLPEKQYQEIVVKPTPETIRASKLITKTARRAIEALTLLRELSDGFQYQHVESGKIICPNCNGNKTITVPVPKVEIDPLKPQVISADDFEDQEIACDNCGGLGEVYTYVRDEKEIGTPKDDYFRNELDLCSDTGRYIVWGGFTGTIDRLVQIANKEGWATLRVDGRGYQGQNADGNPIDSDVLLDAMDLSHENYRKFLEEYPRVCFVGHPQAGGMALTLTASPVELFYSNCFDGGARIQAEDRAHRIGMDKNRGLIIKDLIHLPSDKLVLDNLKQKKRLQSLSMGQIVETLDEEINRRLI